MSRLGIKDNINVSIKSKNTIKLVGGCVFLGELELDLKVGLLVDARAVVEGRDDSIAVGTVDQGDVEVRERRVDEAVGNVTHLQIVRVLANAKGRVSQVVKQLLRIHHVSQESAKVRLPKGKSFPVKGHVHRADVVVCKDLGVGGRRELVGPARYRLVQAEDEQPLR